MNERELHLLPERGWIQKISAAPTPEEQAALKSAMEELRADLPAPDAPTSATPTTPLTTPTLPDRSKVEEIWKAIQARSEIDPSQEDAAAAQAIVEGKLPSGATVIHAVITLPDGRGIINYQAGDGQQQIRF